MAYGITTEDVVAICLTLAGGDFRRPMGDIVADAEREQRRAGLHFGVTDGDLRMAFRVLARWSGLSPSYYDDDLNRAFELPLERWIEPMLEHRSLYFNDEGEHWDVARGSSDREVLGRVRRWLEELGALSREQRLAELERLGWTRAALVGFMERGWAGDQAFSLDNIMVSRLGPELQGR